MFEALLACQLDVTCLEILLLLITWLRDRLMHIMYAVLAETFVRKEQTAFALRMCSIHLHEKDVAVRLSNIS